jgi:hypothetical protein
METSDSELTITDKKVRDVGVGEGYYDDAMEARLGKEVERPFGDVVAKLLKGKDLSGVSLTEKDVVVVMRFADASIYRAQRNHSGPDIDQVKSIGLSADPNMIVNSFLDGIAPGPFDSKLIDVLVNSSGLGLVLPYNCMFLISTGSIETDSLYMPITPSLCFVFGPRGPGNPTDFRAHNPVFVEISDRFLIHFLNSAALQTEIYNKKGIISSDRIELELLGQEYKERLSAKKDV